MDGRFRDIAGRAMANLERKGSDICLVHRDANVGEESRGRRELAARLDNIAPAMSAEVVSSDAFSRTVVGWRRSEDDWGRGALCRTPYGPEGWRKAIDRRKGRDRRCCRVRD